MQTEWPDDIHMIPLYGTDKFMIVSSSDIELVRPYTWCLFRHPGGINYAYAWIDNHMVLLHRHLLQPPKGFVVDHLNNDGLDNRRSNIRIVTPACNSQRKRVTNKSGFRGVKSDHNRFLAYIRINGEKTYLGCFENAEEAAKEYDRAALALYGEHAGLNFPSEAQRAA